MLFRSDSTTTIPQVLFVLVAIWSVDISAFIMMRALERPYVLSVAIMLGYLLLSVSVRAQLFPPEKFQATKRRIFLTLQAFKFADAIIEGSLKAIWSDQLLRLELFNLETDPGETVDLASANSGVAERLKRDIERFQRAQRAFHLLPARARRELAPPAP